MARSGAFAFRLHGLKELDRALAELPKAVGKNVLRKIARKALGPVARDAKANAPRAEGELAKSIRIGTTLTGRQRRWRRRHGAVEMFVGPSWPTGAHGHLQEFGTAHHGAQPFMRPAWDANRQQVLATISDDAWHELAKAARRLARQAETGKLSRGSRRHLGG